MKLTITYKDQVKCLVNGLTAQDKDMLYKEFSVFIPTARYQSKYKLGMWDGKIHYFTLTNQTYVNLLPKIFEKLDISKYEVEYVYPDEWLNDPDLGEEINEDFFAPQVWYKGHRLEGQPIKLEEHQVKIINTCINNHRCLIDSCTSSGKTIMSAALAKLCQPFGKVILVVPSQDLCIQSADEFKLLGLDTGIVGCGLREFNHNIIVCTWQTINSLERRTKGSKKVKENPLSAEELKTLKSGVVALIFDECHQSKSTEIQKVITETFKDVPIKWGLTGTIPKEKSEYYCLLTSLGDKAVSVKSHELQEKGFMASCNINCIRLMDDAVFMDYEDEVNYLSTDDKRLSYIATLIKNIADSGNTLVLLNRIVTGEILERKLNNLGADVVFLQGSVSIKKRKEEYKEVNTVNNKCILATAQIAATGINIPRLFNLVILDFGKSFTRSIQSIGRVLRLAKDKTSANVFDISSILKYSRRHFNERIKYYDDEQHPYHIYKIDNWKNNS